MEKSFKTKTGFCHVLEDKIVLTRDGEIGNISEITVGNSINRILIIYGLIAVLFFYFAYDYFKSEHIFLSILFSCLGFYLGYGIISSLNNSTTPIIFRNKIKEVKFKKGFKGITRSRFEIFFTDESGKIKKRLIMLPGSLSNGDAEIDKALKLFHEDKLIIK